MTRVELEHLIRAAATVADDDEIVVIGSHAILGQFPDAPPELLRSMEADVWPRNHPERSSSCRLPSVTGSSTGSAFSSDSPRPRFRPNVAT